MPAKNEAKATEHKNTHVENTFEEKVLFSWESQERPFKPREKEFWTTVIVIGGLFGFLLFIIEGAISVILIASLIFLFYVLTSVRPEKIKNEITTYGIRVAGSLTEWEFISRFWFTQRLDADLLALETAFLPGKLELVIDPKDKTKIREVMLKFVREEEAPPTSIDKATNWLAQKIPGNS